MKVLQVIGFEVEEQNNILTQIVQKPLTFYIQNQELYEIIEEYIKYTKNVQANLVVNNPSQDVRNEYIDNNYLIYLDEYEIEYKIIILYKTDMYKTNKIIICAYYDEILNIKKEINEKEKKLSELNEASDKIINFVKYVNFDNFNSREKLKAFIKIYLN